MSKSNIVNVSLSDLQKGLSTDICQASVLHLDHSEVSTTHNLIRLARTNSEMKSHLVDLTNKGLFLYKSAEGISSFLAHAAIPAVWQPLKVGEYHHHKGMIYRIEMPAEGIRPRKLLVVLSSMQTDIYKSGLARMFNLNFQSVAKYIPQDTIVLRIADVGSVVGSFYLDNNYDLENSKKVQGLIAHICETHRIPHQSVVLYGASKGGTGALYHAIAQGYHAVCVDPIVSDAFYEEKYRDSHFTQGTFPRTKQSLFTELLNAPGRQLTSDISVIYSSRSPQFPYIDRIVAGSHLAPQMNLIDSDHSKIQDHADVSVHTLNIATMLMNMAFYGYRAHGFGNRVLI